MSSTKKDRPAAVAPEPRPALATAASAAGAPSLPPAIASESASASEAAPVTAAPTSAPAPAPAATETSGAQNHASGSPAPADAQPPLTPGEFRAYNRIADVMNQFVSQKSAALATSEPCIWSQEVHETNADHSFFGAARALPAIVDIPVQCMQEWAATRQYDIASIH